MAPFTFGSPSRNISATLLVWIWGIFFYSSRWVLLWLKCRRKTVFQVCCCGHLILCKTGVDNNLYCLCQYNLQSHVQYLQRLVKNEVAETSRLAYSDYSILLSNVNLAWYSLKIWIKMIFWFSGIQGTSHCQK